MFTGPQVGQYGSNPYTPRTGHTWTATLVSRTQVIDGQPVFVDVEDITYANLSVTDELAGPGNAQLTTSLDAITTTTKARLLDTWRAGCELWIWRDSDHVYSGEVIGGQIQARTLTLATKGVTGYLARMILDTDYVVTDIDQATIVAALIDTFQAKTWGHYGLDTSQLVPSGVTRDLTLLAASATSIDKPIAEMGARDNGYDLWCRPSDRRLFCLSPQRGSDLSNTVIIDARQVVTSSFSWSVTAGQVGSDAVCTSAAAGGPTLVSRAGDDTLRSLAGRSMVSQTFFDVTRQDTLDAHARQVLADSGVQVITISPTLLPVDLPYGGVGPGDRVAFDYDFGLGQQSYIRRIRSVTASVDTSGERLAVEFV